MDRIPSSPPTILPLPVCEKRPLWSVMIPVYNCSNYLPIVLESVLSQDLGELNMQIEVVDDASTDANVEEIVKSLGKGRVQYYRQPINVGSLRNFETCINRSKGKLVHLLHGDDRVKVGFYEKLTWLFERYPEVGAAFCNYSFIDEFGEKYHDQAPEEKEDGILKNWFLRISKIQRIQFVAMAVRREVYEKLGSFYGTIYGEDWEMWVRIAKNYSVAYTPEIFAEYRRHENSISSGQIANDYARAIYYVQQYLPEDKKKLTAKAQKECALISLSRANVIWGETRNKKLAFSQVKLALSLNKSPELYYHILKLYIKFILKVY
ncbi:glycosyltransferase family 2 protein [Adhaeribacter radiodurans]|uniref:Glycosyltransferase n=1 Tax=Adhaeribacter radiodurans TaxID=2745197 RepID=A0A7L7L3U6_9BACT|nr:glycosyltransferase family 2 protein [Adhaeribacter radiodurans]QMU27444.1 glycosyltransferase [Adhaeribacter radiodurans]